MVIDGYMWLYMVIDGYILYESHPHSIRIWDGSTPIFIHETQFKGDWISINNHICCQ